MLVWTSGIGFWKVQICLDLGITPWWPWHPLKCERRRAFLRRSTGSNSWHGCDWLRQMALPFLEQPEWCEDISSAVQAHDMAWKSNQGRLGMWVHSDMWNRTEGGLKDKHWKLGPLDVLVGIILSIQSECCVGLSEKAALVCHCPGNLERSRQGQLVKLLNL